MGEVYVNSKHYKIKMKGSPDFLSSASAKEFQGVLKLYPQALKAKVKSKSKDNGLAELDKWYQEEFGSLMNSRSPAYMSSEELVKMMKWKLSRGKFRPRLVQFAESNAPDFVKNTSEKGIKLAKQNKVAAAITELSKLKGVGPATASGVLAAAVPEKCCFFADEVAAAIPGLAPIKYTAEEYKSVNAFVSASAKRINDESPEDDWTPHKVELAVWTFAVLKTLAPDQLPFSNGKDKENTSNNETDTSLKRKRGDKR